MVPSLALVATLLAADPQFNFGGALQLGPSIPFRNGNAGFQFAVKGFVDIPVAKQFTIGAVLPFGFGFFSQGNNFGSSNTTVIDIMPGARGTLAVLDWVRGVLELGLGPGIQVTEVKVPGLNFAQTDTRTAFAVRAAFSVEIQPPSLSGLFFVVEPMCLHGRFSDQHFSEYRFSVGAGYRR